MSQREPRRTAARLAAIILLALGWGCGRMPEAGQAEHDRNPYYQKAKKMQELRDYKAAAQLFEKALQVNPLLVQAHLELGLLYDDKLGDPITAIYHYRQFLALDPDSSKRQLVEDFIERAKLSMAAKLPQSPIVDPAELMRLQSERNALIQENATLRARVAELERSATAPVVSAAAPVAPSPVLAAPPPSVVREPALAVRESTPPAAPRMHVVQKGDTLQSIALRYYGTRSAWEKIYQANRHSMPSKDELKIGQQLVIP